MKILIFFFIILIQEIISQVEPEPKLYYLNENKQQPAEFSSEETKKLVEEEIKQFDNLPPYKPTTLKDMDINDKQLGLKITQQLYKQASEKGAMKFFQPPQDMNQKGIFFKVDELNSKTLDSFYDYESDSYLQKFKTPEALSSMKKIHKDYYQKEINMGQNQFSFLQKLETEHIKRPKNLDSDFQSSFVQTMSSDKIFFSPLFHVWQRLTPKNCWASSRYEYAFLFVIYIYLPTIKYMWGIPYLWLQRYDLKFQFNFWASYPCASRHSGHSYWFWMSERIPTEAHMKEITFRIEFEQVSRFRFIGVFFMVAPRNIKIETSQDLKYWETVMDWVESPTDAGFWFGWFWSKGFDPMIFAKGMKLVIKGFRKSLFFGSRQGIWDFQTFSQDQTVMIIEKNTFEVPKCLARAEKIYNTVIIQKQNNKPLIFMNCYDAVMQNDQREIFFLNQKQIKQNVDNSCIIPQPKQKGQATQYIVSGGCQHSQWSINRVGKIEAIQYENLCMAAFPDNKIEQFQNYGYVWVSATTSDSRANPYNVVDPNGYGWWAPPPDMAHAEMKVSFDRRYTLERLVIKWKTKPPKYEVQVLTDSSKWKPIIFEEPQDDIDIKISIIEIQAIKIILLDLLEKDPLQPDTLITYGIKKIELYRPGQLSNFSTSMSLQSCNVPGSESRIVNRFKIEQVEYINTMYYVPYKWSQDIMQETYNQSVNLIRHFMSSIVHINETVEKAKKIKEVIKKMVESFQTINNKLNSIGDSFLKQDESAMRQELDYAGSPETAASDCIKIKEAGDFKRGGYYWVKIPCMPEPMRVYCDMEHNYNNFYVYTGFKRQKILAGANTRQGIVRICGEIGLKPVRIRSKQAYEHIVEYLNQAQANSEDDYVIPIGYKYNFGPFSTYRSFNDPDSPTINEFVLDYLLPMKKVESYTDLFKRIGKGMDQFFSNDALVLKMSPNKLTSVKLINEKVRGVVCSQNLPRQNGRSSNMIFAKCNDSIQEIKSRINIGEQLSVNCPRNCLIGVQGESKNAVQQASAKQTGRVWKNDQDQFSYESAVCKAGLFAGQVKDLESTTIQIKIVKLKFFQPVGGENNGVVLDETANPVDVGFKFVIKNLKEECPNLAKKQSFLSFDEVVQQINNKKSQSFIETGEKESITTLQRTILKNQIAETLKDPKVEKEEPVYENDMPKENSQKAINYIKGQLEKRLDVTRKYMRYVFDSKSLVIKQTRIMKNIFDSDLNPLKQGMQVHFLDHTLQQLQASSKAMMVTAGNMLKQSEADLHKEIDAFLVLKRFGAHDEKYRFFQRLETYYEIKDYPNLKYDSNWKYTDFKYDSLHPHKQAIKQQSTISCMDNLLNPTKECTSTSLEVKYKTLYDFNLKLSFNVQNLSQGFISIIFRRKDDFNYYSVDLNEKWVRIKRMLNGKNTIIASNPLSPTIQQNKWYNFQMQAVQNIFKVMLIGELMDGTNQLFRAPLIIQAEDLYFKSGSIALSTDNAQTTFFDDFFIEPLPCFIDGFDPEKKIIYEVKTNRFREMYRSDINIIWQQSEDPNDIRSNPFIYKANYEGRRNVIYNIIKQTAQEAHILLLKDKFFDIGTIGFQTLFQYVDQEFYIAFYYKNKQNMLRLQISPTAVALIELFEGQKNILAIDKTVRKVSFLIQVKTWYSFYINATRNKITVQSVNMETRELYTIFPNDIDRQKNQQRGQIYFKTKKKLFAVDKFFIDPNDISLIYEKVDINGEIDNSVNTEVDLGDITGDQRSSKIISPEEEQKSLERSKKRAIRKASENDTSVRYQICIKTRDQDARENYCSSKHQGSEIKISQCVDFFCPSCCGNVLGTLITLGPNEPQLQELCINQCKKSEVPPIYPQFKQCVDSFDPKRSVSRFCSFSYQNGQKYQKDYCSMDLCQSCCVTMPIQLRKNIELKQIKECQEKCMLKYNEEEVFETKKTLQSVI